MSDIRKRIESMEKAVKEYEYEIKNYAHLAGGAVDTRRIELDGINYEYYDVVDGYGRVVDRFINPHELPAAEYLDPRPAEYDMIERKPPPPAAKPERFSR
jgi:hypothetical protein